jgi:hypothetical protein
MSYRRFEESADDATRRLIGDYRHAASYRPVIVRTLEKWGGKVYNKRFLDALRTEAGYDRIYADRRESIVHIYIYSAEGYTQFTIVSIPLQDRRINAAEAIKNAGERYTAHTRKAAEIEQTAPEIPTYKQQLADLDRIRAQIIGRIPYDLRDIYDIR